jgi:pimeloyl-ACP methyl ester carboxylesterase
MSIAAVNGARLFYSLSGKGSPPIVLVPGWCCDQSSMAPLAERLRESRRVMTFDPRGLGKSEMPVGPLKLIQLVDDVRSLCGHLGLEKPVLVGHSLGGRIVLALLEEYPDFARAAVLLDTAVDEDPAYVRTRRSEVEGDAWETAMQRRFAALLSPISEAGSSALVARMQATPIVTARAFLRAADGVDGVQALSGLRVPLLYIGASTPRESQEHLLQLNPAILFGQVVGSGHFVHVDATAQVASMTERFIDIIGGGLP